MAPMILMHSFSCAGVRCKSALNTEALGPNSMRSTQLSKSLCTDAAFTAPAALDTMVTALKFRLKYDNGFVAYLNGAPIAEENVPANPNWISTAPSNSPRDSRALEFVEFDLSARVDQLVDGQNVLAIHGLNNLSDVSDFLLVPELIADRPISQSSIGYLPAPTPGAPNFGPDAAVTGPLITDVTDHTGALDDGQDVVVTATVTQLNAAIASVSLSYRPHGPPRQPSTLPSARAHPASAGQGFLCECSKSMRSAVPSAVRDCACSPRSKTPRWLPRSSHAWTCRLAPHPPSRRRLQRCKSREILQTTSTRRQPSPSPGREQRGQHPGPTDMSLSPEGLRSRQDPGSRRPAPPHAQRQLEIAPLPGHPEGV